MTQTHEAEETKQTDPVCGMSVLPSKAAATLDHQGHTYFFCGKGCATKFQADPDKYLQPKPAAAPPTAAEQSTEYTCPMDPEIVQLGPGTCPICGMALEPVNPTAGGEEANQELKDMTRRLWIAAALCVPLLAFMLFDMAFPFIIGYLGMPRRVTPLAMPHPITTRTWIEFIFATPVVLWCGWPFFVRGAQSIRNRRGNMFTLIALGTGVAYIYSVIALLLNNDAALYFEPAAVIVTLVLVGQVLELRARNHTGAALRALAQLAPADATLLTDCGHEKTIPLAQVKPGQRLRVKPGERVPVDGTVLEGSSSVDESMVSGESIPVEKLAGARVIAGTLNGNGTFILRAEHIGSDTLLAHIVRMVSAAQRTRAPIQRLADRVASIFVPAVLLIAAVTFITWWLLGDRTHAMLNAVAVLIVACPCALGLATPMAIMVGTGRGAHAGILIRDAESLERFASVNTLLVDKTGTLTEGKPRVISIHTSGTISEEELLRLTASVEAASEHPLAAAITGAAREQNLALAPITNFEATPGMGITAAAEDHAIAVGNEAMMNKLGISITSLGTLEESRSRGESAILIAIDSSFAGIIAVSDTLRSSAHETIGDLQREGIAVAMLTGDHEATAKHVADQLGIPFTAGTLPADKAAAVRLYQQQVRTVAMAGDGINDAPALAAADVGVAMGTGTALAMETAGITVLHGDLRAILRARRLSRATLRNIRQNLFFAFAYNALGIPIAAGVLYPHFGILLGPGFAAAAMSLSSVSVIANALRLRTTKL